MSRSETGGTSPSRAAKPSLIFQPVPGDALTNGFHAYWERTADSFVKVAGGSAFAMKGTLNAALDATALADASIDITFTGDDWDLEETTFEEATTKQPLQALVNGEWRMGSTCAACKESPLPSVIRIWRSTTIATSRYGNSAAA